MLFLTGILFCSCSNSDSLFIEPIIDLPLFEDPEFEQPVGVLAPENFFQTADNIQTAVNISFVHMMNEDFWGSDLSTALMLRSDMVALQAIQNRREGFDSHNISPESTLVFNPWARAYRGINAANTAILGAESVDESDNIKNPIIAQAYFVRAWYYFHLVRLHGDIPYVTELNMNPSTDEELAALTTPISEELVYENIINDLEFAKLWLPVTVSSRAIPSKAAASSYLALVYLTMADYQNAWNEAKEVIDNAGVYNLGLDPDFQNLFNADYIDNSLEPIFSIDYNNFLAPDNGYDSLAAITGVRGDEEGDGGWSVAVPSMAVYNSFDLLDYRTRVSFQTETTINATTIDYTQFDISGHIDAANHPYIAKYTRYPGSFARVFRRATSHNYSMLRYAELLLIAAESAIEIGDNASALLYVNMVRERARNGGNSTNGGYIPEIIPPSTTPANLTSITIDDVLEERRIELAFEGKRWYDIKRRRLGNEVFSANGYEGFKPDFNESVDYLITNPE